MEVFSKQMEEYAVKRADFEDETNPLVLCRRFVNLLGSELNIY